MNLSPSAVFVIIGVVATASILILLAVSARSRAGRARQFAEVDALLASSPADKSREPGREAGPETRDPWLPASDGWPTSRHQWSEASDGWPTSGAFGAAGARRAEPTDPALEPFEFPAPTPLEQRYKTQDQPTEDLDAVEAESDDEDFESEDAEAVEDAEVKDAEVDEDEDDDDMNDTDMQLTDEDEFESSAEMDDEGADEADEALDDEPEMAPDDEPEMAPDDEPEMAPDDEPGAAQAAQAASPSPSPIPIGRSTARHGRDALTGLLDATAFEEAMSHEEAREQRYSHPATVIVFELDGLAKLVDRLGSDPGDRIETALGDTIMRLARRADYAARLERGRYAVLLPETDEVAAINYVERIRRACDLWLESGAIAMRLAIGWASTTGDAGLSGAVRIATDRMRVELRRNSRQVGGMVPDVEAGDEGEDHVMDDAVGI
jgi:diguanylate cyclase (GGDEF)-like protein